MTAAATAALASGAVTRRSREADRLTSELLAVDPLLRREFLGSLDLPDFEQVLAVCRRELGTPYGLWQDDPVGLVEDVLGETTWSKQREVLAAIPHHQRVAVPAGFDVGKCWHPDEPVVLANGEVARAGDLVGRSFEVVSWAPDGTQTPRRAVAEWNRTESTRRLTTESGRVVVRNHAHPLWAATLRPTAKTTLPTGERTCRAAVDVRGWTPVGDLAVGDLILVPEWHAAEGERRVPRDYALLLGYLLGDGGTTTAQVTFTQQDGPALDEFTAVAGRLGCELIPMARPFHYRLRSGPRGGHRTNPVVELTREWGLYGKRAPEKAFPAWAWTLPNDQLALVVGRLLACDGWAYVGPQGRAEVALCSASEALVRDLSRAMLRLGVWGCVRRRTVAYAGGRRVAWTWTCRERAALLRLAEAVEVPGKDAAIAAVTDVVREPRAKAHKWPRQACPAGYRWDRVASVEDAGDATTVAIEVEGEHTLVGDVVEHNTHIAARALVWRAVCWPVGGSLTVTTATRMRQVARQLWPHVRAIHARCGLPGEVDIAQWKMPDAHGVSTVVAYGFSAPDNDEVGAAGIHAPNLFLIIDEAGGIGHVLGQSLRGAMTGEHTRALLIGNPPTDDEQSWFEKQCGQENVHVIRIPATASPQITGEPTKECRTCPEGTAAHTVGSHVVDKTWVEETVREYGEESNFVQSKVDARFPRGGASRAIPSSWVEKSIEEAAAIAEAERFSGDLPYTHPPIRDGDNPDDGEEYLVQPDDEAWVRLGVDVAADGGDEFVVARADGDVVRIVHASSGPQNENQVHVAGIVLREIHRAEKVRHMLGSPHRIRVKVDANGMGIGVWSILTSWRAEGRHDADIVKVMVSERPDRRRYTGKNAKKAAFTPHDKRAEMWLAGRSLLQPDASGRQGLRLAVDDRTAAQLSAPTYFTNSAGETVIEPKKKIKRKGLKSPDRGEAVLLSVYEPEDLTRRSKVIA